MNDYPAEKGETWFTAIFCGFTAAVTYVVSAAIVFALLYGSRSPEWLNTPAFRVMFSISLATANVLALATSLVVSSKTGGSAVPTVLVSTIFLLLLNIPTLLYLTYLNNCLGLPGPGPFGGSGLGCG